MASISPDLIYDIGLHDGQDTDYYLKKGFRVVAVEANPVLAEGATRRFEAAIASGQLVILNVAIAPEEREFEFFVNHQNSKWSSLHASWGKRGAKGFEVIKVPGRRLQDIVAEHGVPHYLKIDIEGADLLALKAVADFPATPNFISVEGGGENFLNLFADYGFDRFASVNQAKVPEIPQMVPAREGVAVEHVFPLGATGPFGREITERWLTLEEVRADRAAFRARVEALEAECRGNKNLLMRRRGELDLGWFDVHAARADFLAA